MARSANPLGCALLKAQQGSLQRTATGPALSRHAVGAAPISAIHTGWAQDDQWREGRWAGPPSRSRRARLLCRDDGKNRGRSITAVGSPHLLRLVRRCRRVCRYVCRVRQRLHVQRLHRIVAAGFRRLARVGFACLLGGRVLVFRPGPPQRTAGRPLWRPASRSSRHDPDRPRPCCRKRGAQPAGSLRGLRPRRRAWHRFLLCSDPGCRAAMVRQTPRSCIRSRRERNRCRHAGHAARRRIVDRRHGMARGLPRARHFCGDRGRRNGPVGRGRSAPSRLGDRRRSAASRCATGATRRDRRPRRATIAAVHRALRREPARLVRGVRAVRSPRALRHRSRHPAIFGRSPDGRDRHRQHQRPLLSRRSRRSAWGARFLLW